MTIKLRPIQQQEKEQLGKLLVSIYAKLDGFPSLNEQPEYYNTLLNIGDLTIKDGVEVWVAINSAKQVVGGGVYYRYMSEYGASGLALEEKNTSGIRLIGVDPATRGQGIAKALTQQFIQLAKQHNNQAVILHTTKAMQVAWDLYLKLGFKRFPKVDFNQQDLAVFGFKLDL
ncbi:GNAT family N-acetyltransferase [Aliikangiella sp. IMCC44632]